MVSKTFLLAAAILMIAAAAVVAGSHGTEAKAEVKQTGEHVDFEGKLVCLGCDLKQAEGARAACKAFGHKHALKTSDGRYVNFLENQYSTDLINGEKYHNKDLKVHGIYYANANQLDVETFHIDDKKMSWCGHCSAMDGCMASKGDK